MVQQQDLYSILITGPSGTPYEDCLFLFDLRLPDNYPVSPPEVHYHSYCTDRLNPNLYEEGKVCVSLLGTWTGKGNETWTSKSSVHQLLLSIQGNSIYIKKQCTYSSREISYLLKFNLYVLMNLVIDQRIKFQKK